MESNFYFTARGYELDGFGHINHSVYINYYEQARWEILKEYGIFEYLKNLYLHAVVIEMNVVFRKELLIFDEAKVYTRLKKDGSFLIAIQKIMLCKSDKLISNAKFKLLFVNQNRMPHSIPQEILNRINPEYVTE